MNDLCNNVAMHCNISKAQHAMNEPHIHIFVSRRRRKGPVTLFDLGREGPRIWRTHSPMTSHRPCSSHTRDLEGEECQTFYVLVKNIIFQSYLYLSFCGQKNRSWGDKLKIDCNILNNDPQKYNSLSEKIYQCCQIQEPYNFIELMGIPLFKLAVSNI